MTGSGPRHSTPQDADERQQLRQAEVHISRLTSQIEYYKAELAEIEGGVRYRLGDALVRALRPSWDTLKLPGRLLGLAADGLRRRRARRREAERRRRETSAVPDDRMKKRVEFEPEPGVLREPFARVSPELRRRDDLRVALVADEFSWPAWQYEADVYTFTPDDWQGELDACQPDVLLIESAWKGVGGSWYLQLCNVERPHPGIRHRALPDIVAWCRQHGVPTVFYNKEDPPHFDVFIDAARQF